MLRDRRWLSELPTTAVRQERGAQTIRHVVDVFAPDRKDSNEQETRMNTTLISPRANLRTHRSRLPWSNLGCDRAASAHDRRDRAARQSVVSNEACRGVTECPSRRTAAPPRRCAIKTTFLCQRRSLLAHNTSNNNHGVHRDVSNELCVAPVKREQEQTRDCCGATCKVPCALESCSSARSTASSERVGSL